MNGRRALYGAVGLLSLTSACLAFDGAGGAEEDFCLARPSICAEANPIDRSDAGTSVQKDGGTTFDGGTSWTFSPGKMGMIGSTMDHGGSPVYCDIKNADVSYGGLPSARIATIHPKSGSLYYLNDSGSKFELRRFTVDRVFRKEVTSYPEDWVKNDPIVPTPQCDAQDGIQSFLIRPDGSIVYRCRNENVWFDATTGQAIETCRWARVNPNVVAFSEDGASLCNDTVMDAAGVEHPIIGNTFGRPFFGERSKPGGGFWVAMYSHESNRFERWTIANDGTATQDGIYAEAPAEWRRANDNYTGVANLDAEGNLYRWGVLDQDFSPDVIVEFSADFTSSNIVYDESKTEVCNIHVFVLVTTP